MFMAVAFCLSAIAGDHPEAHFGEFGLEHLPSASDYQKYIGQTVQYMAKEKPSYDDRKFEELFKGRMGVPYIIQKVSGNEKKIKFELVEKDNPKVKVKFEFLNYPEYYSYGKNTFCNTAEYQVPLFLIDKFNEAASQFENKPLKVNGDKYVTIKGIKLIYPKDEYPVPAYVIDNPLFGGNSVVAFSDLDDFAKIVGKEYSDKDCNFTLTVVNYKVGDRSNYNVEQTYTIRNSATGKTTDVKYQKATGRYGYSSGTTPQAYANEQFTDAKSGKYVATLSKVEKPSNSSIRYGETTVIEDAEKGITKFSYVDNVIEMVIIPTRTKFTFELKNISPNSIKIIWDEAAFVDADGSTSKVMHVGTKYSERNSSQPATTVIKNAKIEDVATPTDRVYYSETLKEWTSKSMYPNEPKLKNKQIQLMLPIQIKDVVNEYIFVFDLDYVLNHPELLNNPEF